MYLFFAVCVNLLPSDFHISKLERLSMNAPVYINFHIQNSSISRGWIEFSKINKENDKINCALVHCSRSPEICKRFSITKPSIFLIIYRKYYSIQKVENESVEVFKKLYKDVLRGKFSCAGDFLPSDEKIKFQYPTYVLKYKDESTCTELSKYRSMYRNATFYIRKAQKVDPIPNSNIDLCNSPSNCLSVNKYYNPVDFIEEFMFDHFGNWSVGDVSHISRRLSLIVYDDSNKVKNLPKRSDFERYIKSYQIYYLFGAIPFSSLSNSIEPFKSVDETPFMILTNTKKTRFMIVDFTRMSYGMISDKLNSARQGFLELQMKYFFDEKFAMKNCYNPKRVKEFSIAALSVVFFTALLIFRKAYSCINMYGNRYKGNASIEL